MSQLYAVPPVPPGDASGKDEDKNEGHEGRERREGVKVSLQGRRVEGTGNSAGLPASSPSIINFVDGSRKTLCWGNTGAISCSFYSTSLGQNKQNKLAPEMPEMGNNSRNLCKKFFA